MPNDSEMTLDSLSARGKDRVRLSCKELFFHKYLTILLLYKTNSALINNGSALHGSLVNAGNIFCYHTGSSITLKNKTACIGNHEKLCKVFCACCRFAQM